MSVDGVTSLNAIWKLSLVVSNQVSGSLSLPNGQTLSDLYREYVNPQKL